MSVLGTGAKSPIEETLKEAVSAPETPWLGDTEPDGDDK